MKAFGLILTYHSKEWDLYKNLDKLNWDRFKYKFCISIKRERWPK